MKRNHREFPLKLLAAFGALLNTVWELAQCLFLCDMTGWSIWKRAAYMSASIAGDVLIVLGVVLLPGSHSDDRCRRYWVPVGGSLPLRWDSSPVSCLNGLLVFSICGAIAP
jgi:hypothetical protein